MKNAVRVLAMALIGISLAGLVWGLWPLKMEQHRLEYAAPQAGLLPAGEYVIEARWPARMRIGEVGQVQLSLEQQGLPPGVVGLARLDLPGASHSPTGDSSQPLASQQPARFEYRLQMSRPGAFTGTLWLHRVWVSEGGPGQPLAAIPITIQAISFLGLSGPWARALGAAGVVVGVALFFAFPQPARHKP